ncbi:unnamed protein product [Tilletia caries]|nr:unnamed protein product [Tilletia caries]
MNPSSPTNFSNAQAHNSLTPIPPPAAANGSSAGSAIAIADDDPVVIAPVPKTLPKRSSAWDDFEHLVDQRKVQCTRCGHKLSFVSVSKTGTSSMTRHQDACRKKRKPEGGQQLLSFAPKMPSAQKLKLHALLQRWIVRDQQSLSVVAHPDFRAFLSAAAGGYDPPSRYVLTNKIRNDYEDMKPTENALREACKVRGITFKMPPTVMDVRWNSTYKQLLSLQDLEPALRLMFADRKHASLAWGQPVWHAIQDLTKILEVFSDVSEHIQGRKYPTISAAAQGYVLISTELDALGTSPSLTAWGIEVVKLFQNRLVSYREHLIDAPLVQWATLLDPSMKTKVIECDGVHLVVDAVGSLMEHLVAFYPDNSPTSSTFVPSADAATSSFQQRWEKMDSAPTTSHLLNPRKQLHIYLQEPAIKSNVASDSLRYWAVNEGRFPSLSAMARDLLAIPATSVPSEATFSRGGEVITKRRNRLNGTTVTAIMCLDSWMEGGFDSIRAFDLEDIVEPIEVEE